MSTPTRARLAGTHTARGLVLAFAVSMFVSMFAASSFAVLSATSASAASGKTVVRSWSTAALEVQPGGALRVPLRVSTGSRHRTRSVRLQVRTSRTAAWSKPGWRRTTHRGQITLHWKAPARASTRWLRVQVRRGPGQPAAVTRPRRVRVGVPTPAPTPTPTPAPTPAPTPTPGPAPTPDPDLASEVVRLTNQARAQARTCGTTQFPAVGPVTAHPRLAAAAQGHALDMATQDYFAHDSLDGRDPGRRITEAGYAWRTYGENIAAGYATAQAVVEGWLSSPGHCRNIMNGAFTELGVGHTTSSSARYGTYWAQNFAAPR